MGKPRRSPTASQKIRSSLMTLLPSPDLRPRLGSTIHICRILPSYPLPVDPPLPGLPLPRNASRGGQKKVSLLLSAASTGRCGDRYKFSWNSYTVLYTCCWLQETLPKSPNQPGCAVFKVRRCWRNLRGPSGICSLCFLLHLPIQSEVSWLPLSDP